MKYFVLLLSLVTCIVQAQNIKVVNIERLTNLKDGEFVVSAVSPKGDKIIASSPAYKGLYIIDVKQKNIIKISEKAGAGYEPIIIGRRIKSLFQIG
jgi:hypothetical protein